MSPRPYWKGYLKLSLVTCAVQLSPATTSSEKVSFHTINRRTQNRVVSRYIDSVTGKTVDDEDEVKGYERGEDDYVLIEDDELEDIALETTKTIDVSAFTKRDDVGWIWLDSPYFLTPRDKVSNEAFCVIRDAMKQEKMVGLSKLVLGRRERAVMLEPRDKGIILWTLRYGDEVRKASDYFSKLTPNGDEKKTLPLIKKLIKKQTQDWSDEFLQDPVQDKLEHLIEAKKKQQNKPKKKSASKPKNDEPPNNVINIMDALKRSLEKNKGSKK